MRDRKLEESREMHGTKGPGGKQIRAAAWNAHSSNQTIGCTKDAFKVLSEITLKQLESKLDDICVQCFLYAASFEPTPQH